MKRRRLLAALVAAGLAVPARGLAQPRVLRVDFLIPTTRKGYEPRIERLKRGLRELGYVDGNNLRIEYRSVEDDRLPKLAAELVALKVMC